MFRGANNGGSSSLGRRERDDEEDEDGNKKEKLSFEIPKPLFPNRKDIPRLPIIDTSNYNMIECYVKLKHNIPYSIYNLSRDSIKPKDNIERYSNRFNSNKSNNNIELSLSGIKFGYFPYELVVVKKKTKNRANIPSKTIEELQRLEKEGGGEGENGEDGENEEEEEDEEEVEGDYADDMGNDDDSDGGGDSDGGNEADF